MMLVAAILVVLVQIFVHELGHFLAARLMKVPVSEFAIGFGPKLLSRESKRTGTVYSLRAIPMGGYCNIQGLDEGNVLELIPIHRQLWIYVGGVIGNLVFSFIVMIVFVVSMNAGLVRVTLDGQAPLLLNNNNYVQGEASDVAQYMTVESVEYDGKVYSDMDGIRSVLGGVNGTGEDRVITFHLSDLWRKADIQVKQKTVEDVYYGISYGKPLGLIDSLKSAVGTFKQLIALQIDVFRFLSNQIFSTELVLNEIPPDVDVELKSVVGFVAEVGGIQDAIPGYKYRMLYILNATMVIGVSLAAFNLLPIPCLDGGRVVIALVEGVIRKSLSDKLKTAFIMTSFAVLMGFSILIMVKDVIDLITM